MAPCRHRAPGARRAPWLAAAVLSFVLAGPAAAQDDASDAYHQALANYKAGHYEAALVMVGDAEQQAPGDPNTEILKCRILTELGHYDLAKKALDTLEGNPHLTPADGQNWTMAYGDLCLRKRDYAGAIKSYQSLASALPDDADLTLRLVYAFIGAGDLSHALSYASKLKPLDQVNPSYYFAHAALAEATGKSAGADNDIETVRTIYGITVTNRYLRTYLQATSHTAPKSGLVPKPAPANAAPAGNQP